MEAEIRRILDGAYAPVHDTEVSPSAFAGNYALCLGIIMGASACGGLTEEEAAEERAHLAMLAALFEFRQKADTDQPD